MFWECVGGKREGWNIRYIKSVLSLDRYTLDYMVLKETQKDRIRIEAGQRAMKFEEKVKEEERREKERRPSEKGIHEETE